MKQFFDIFGKDTLWGFIFEDEFLKQNQIRFSINISRKGHLK